LLAFLSVACHFFTVAEANVLRHTTPGKTCFRGFYDAKIEKILPKPAPGLVFTQNYP